MIDLFVHVIRSGFHFNIYNNMKGTAWIHYGLACHNKWDRASIHECWHVTLASGLRCLLCPSVHGHECQLHQDQYPATRFSFECSYFFCLSPSSSLTKEVLAALRTRISPLPSRAYSDQMGFLLLLLLVEVLISDQEEMCTWVLYPAVKIAKEKGTL